MNERDDLDRMLSTWLDDPLTLPAPRYLGEVLDRTRVVRQRPAWASLERWLPMVIVQRRSTVARPALVAMLGTILILAVLAASTALPFLAGAVTPPAATSAKGLVAFAHEGDIYVVEPSPGAEPRAIVSGADHDVEPWLSPDGRHLVFLRVTDDGEVPMLTDAGGSAPLALTPEPIVGAIWLDWSPDSRSLLIVLGPDQPVPGQRGMFLLAIDGSGTMEPIGGPDVMPDPVTMGAIRPGGASLEALYRAATDPAELRYVATDGGSLSDGQALTVEDIAGVRTTAYGGDFDFHDATWAPDGSRFAYHTLNDVSDAQDGNGFRVHVARYDRGRTGGEGSAAHDDRLIEFDPLSDDESSPLWSPDGTKLAFQTYEDGGAQLVIVPVRPDGSVEPDRIVATEPVLTFAWDRLRYTWAPDGTSLVLVTNIGAGGKPAYLVDAATGDMEPLGWESDVWLSWRIPAS